MGDVMHHIRVALVPAAAISALIMAWTIVRVTPEWDLEIWIAVLSATLSVFLAFATTRQVLFVSPQIAFVAMYVILIHVGAIGFYHSDPADNGRFILLSSLALTAFSVPLAYAWILHRSPKPEGGIVNDLVDETEVVWNIFATVGVLGAFYYLLRGASATGGLPLLHTFHGFASVRSLAESRLAFATGATGYLYEFYGVILPISAVAFMLRWLSTGSRRHRRKALALLGLSAFTLIAAGYRGPVELFLVLVAIALSYGLGSLRNKTGVAIGVLAAAAFAVLSLGYYSNDSGVSAGQGMMARVFEIQADGPQFVAQSFPSLYPYTDGTSLAHDLEGAFHDHQAGFSSELPALRGAKSLNNPVGAAFDAYANFGPVGLAVVMFSLGLMTLAIHRRLVRERTVSAIALAAGLSAALAYGALTGIAGVLLQFGVVTVGLMAVAQSLLRLGRTQQTINLACQRGDRTNPLPEAGKH